MTLFSKAKKFCYTHLANAITLLGLFLGIFGFFSFIFEKYLVCAIVYFGVVIVDFLDGFVARKLSIQSKVGELMDTLSDFSNFCILPSIMILRFFLGPQVNYTISISSIRIIISVGFFLSMGMIRLCRFVILGGTTSYYIGLPVTANGIFMSLFAVMIFLVEISPPTNPHLGTATGIFMILLGIFMIQTFHLPKFFYANKRSAQNKKKI